jgi:hypothetical protein
MPLGGHHSRDNRANVPFNENTHLLERCFREAGITRRSQALSSLSTSIISLIVASDQAQAHLEKNQGRREGETWENWVCRVTEILQQHQLPTGVRKDTDKNKARKPSPFVSLIYELQHLIPEGRPGCESLGAIAAGLEELRHFSGARRQMVCGAGQPIAGGGPQPFRRKRRRRRRVKGDPLP